MTAAFNDNSYGYAIPSAYEHDRAVDLKCSSCGAPAGEWCEKDNEIKKIPCTSRLHAAYITNNPEGRRIHAERQAHLEHHQKHFQPSWTGK